MIKFEVQSTAETVADFVIAAQNGDREAFGTLVERYERAIYNVAMSRLRNHAEAQELCQDVFLQALLKIHQLREPAAFGGWLRSIAVRMSINRAMRAGGTVSTEPEIIEAWHSHDETPLCNALVAEQKDQVRCGIARLNEMDRRTIESFYFHGNSIVQMSDHFAAPVGTIKRRLHVARKRLARHLEGATTA